MKPKIPNMVAWNQAETLMQPALIRIVDNLTQQIEQTAWKATYEEVQDPYPGYRLHLNASDRHVELDLWNLCYRVCFRDYPTDTDPSANTEIEVAIDTHLLDNDSEVNWNRLDDKAKQVVGQVFENLPAV